MHFALPKFKMVQLYIDQLELDPLALAMRQPWDVGRCISVISIYFVVPPTVDVLIIDISLQHPRSYTIHEKETKDLSGHVFFYMRISQQMLAFVKT